MKTEKDEPGVEIDEREFSDWFEHMTPAAQAELRAEWARKGLESDRRDRRSQAALVNAVVEACVIFGVCELVFFRSSLLQVLTGLGIAAGVGAAWWRLRSGPIVSTICGMAGLMSNRALFRPWVPHADIFGIVIFVCLCYGAAIVRRSSRLEGS